MVSLSLKIRRGTVLRLEIILVNFSSRDSSYETIPETKLSHHVFE